MEMEELNEVLSPSFVVHPTRTLYIAVGACTTHHPLPLTFPFN
jgi:hypothetical protein